MSKIKKVCFLLVAHLPNDDRVWFHQAKCLKENGFDVSIISTITAHSDLENSFCFNATGMKRTIVSRNISNILNEIKPDIIICDNPLSVFYASRFKKKYLNKTKLMMDVTEWYPSKKNLVNLNNFQRFIKKLILQCLNFYSGFLVDGFIFGEEFKAQFFKKYFKKKPYINLPYYPDLEYIRRNKLKDDFSVWHISYSGLLTKDKGFDNVLKAMRITALNNSNIQFTLSIISNESFNDAQKSEINTMPENIEIQYHSYLPFEQFCKKIVHYDMFLDLREKDKENNKCLPIKLFYYMACGCPVIFSDLDAIKMHIPEINEFACTVNPNDEHEISQHITEYIRIHEKYKNHASTALEYAEKKYNWRVLSTHFLKFIEDAGH